MKSILLICLAVTCLINSVTAKKRIHETRKHYSPKAMAKHRRLKKKEESSDSLKRDEKPKFKQFEDQDIDDVLYKIDHPNYDSNESVMTPSEQVDPTSVTHENFEEKEESESEAEHENLQDEESESNSEEDESEETDPMDKILGEPDEEDEDLSDGDLLKKNITMFHRQQMKCLDKHFLQKPGEQWSFEAMMVQCNGEDNIEIQRFYNDIDWQIKDFLRQGIYEQLRPGFCDKIFMQCYEYVSNVEVFMGLDYDIAKSIKANLVVLLDHLEMDAYIQLRELTTELVREFDEIMVHLEDKKEFMAEYFSNKEKQYNNEYETEGHSEETEPESESEKTESENSQDTDSEKEEKLRKKIEEEDKAKFEEAAEKKKEKKEDFLNVFTGKPIDGDEAFVNIDTEPELGDLVPGFEKKETIYEERKQGNAAVEIDHEKANKIANKMSKSEKEAAEKEKVVYEKANRDYLKMVKMRTEMDEEENDSEYNEAKELEPTPQQLQMMQGRGLWNKEREMSKRIQKMLKKDMKRAQKRIDRKNKRGPRLRAVRMKYKEFD